MNIGYIYSVKLKEIAFIKRIDNKYVQIVTNFYHLFPVYLLKEDKGGQP